MINKTLADGIKEDCLYAKKTEDWKYYSQCISKAVRRYINEQEGKDVFEYSVFGSPNQKIGNFTGQKKLGDFNA